MTGHENMSQNYRMGGVIHMFILVECCDRNMELLGVHDKKNRSFCKSGITLGLGHGSERNPGKLGSDSF